MHSLKNTFVAVLLLGASYGVYQAITTPDPQSIAELDLPTQLPLELGGQQSLAKPAPAVPDGLPDLYVSQGAPPASQRAFPGSEAPSNPIPQAPLADSNEFRLLGGVEDPNAESQATQQIDDRVLIEELKQQIESRQTESGAGGALIPVQPQMPAPAELAFLDRGVQLSAAELEGAWAGISQLVDEGRIQEALRNLSRFYNANDVQGVARKRLMSYLNSLAGIAIYSAEYHLYQSAYQVKDGQQLTDLAREWQVTPELIYRINMDQIADPNRLEAGTPLKVIQGPFHGQLDRATGTLTLFVKNMYAGQFSVRLDDANQIQAGTFGVLRRTRQTGLSEQIQIELDGGLRIASQGLSAPGGTIGVNAETADELFTILSETSQIQIR